MVSNSKISNIKGFFSSGSSILYNILSTDIVYIWRLSANIRFHEDIFKTSFAVIFRRRRQDVFKKS